MIEHRVNESACRPDNGLGLLGRAEGAQIAQHDHGFPADEEGEGRHAPFELLCVEPVPKRFERPLDLLDAAVAALWRFSLVRFGGGDVEANQLAAQLALGQATR